MKFKTIFPSVALILICVQSYGQSLQPSSFLDNLHPVTPSTFQFLKYAELPVSEYTGIPEINVPLYKIEADGLSLPLNLNYYAGGIRVNQEASWVGLGWDMQIGSIIQQVNDLDDYQTMSDTNIPVTRDLPDFFNTGNPTVYPRKYLYEYLGSPCNYNCDDALLPVNTPVAAYGFEVYTDGWVPVRGQYASNHNLLGSYGGNIVDSEPDIFTANFLGHSLKFMVDWNYSSNHSGYQIIVLNKKGYNISRDGDIWKIFVPGGEEFDFELKSVVLTKSSSDDTMGGGTTSSPYQPSSIIWMLTKIVSKNGQVITINYNTTPQHDTYPTFTQKKTFFKQTGSLYTNADQFRIQYGLVKPYGGYGGVSGSRSYSKESSPILSSIIFPKGRVDFFISDRNDVAEGKKLDSVLISAGQKVKSFKMNYDYFDASNVGGNSYTIPGFTDPGNYSRLRLKLLSVDDNVGNRHVFSYSAVNLPVKNSFAVDYWGYYNGQTSNTTFVLNPAQFTRSVDGNIDRSSLGNNGDNHSANANYTEAGMLKSIQLPTGGKVNFSFELNSFDNYWVPDFANSNNIVSSGNGLRIKDITFFGSDNNQQTKTSYTYFGGKSISPALFFRQYSTTQLEPGLPQAGAGYATVARYFELTELGTNGIFSSNPFASVNGVGYAQVDKQKKDQMDNNNGKISTFFHNNVDLFTTSATTVSEQAAALPTIKQRGLPQNGSIDSVMIYDQRNTLIKKIKNSYNNINSPLFYGARMFGYDQFEYFLGDGTLTTKSRVMVGYYPIYDFETLLTSSIETNYSNGITSTIKTSTGYDSYNRVTSTTVSNSEGASTTDYSYETSSINNNNDLLNRNRLLDIRTIIKSNNNSLYSRFDRKYQAIGNLIVPAYDDNYLVFQLVPSDHIDYDLFDTTNGQLRQYTSKGTTKSFIYDYSNNYLIAEILNAPLAKVAYTSFEADGKGNWNFSGSPVSDSYAPTGNKSYNLSSGSVTSAILPPDTYIISYWSKNGEQQVSNSAVAVKGESTNGYTYFSHEVSLGSNSQITVAGTGTIDELRLYPKSSQMTTYTYKPLVGLTSISDKSSRVTSYEYDSALRLINVRNQNGDIVKNISYNYAGQATAQ